MQDLENVHFIVKAIRSMFLDQVESLPTWTTCRSLASKAQTPLMYVGFLPYLSYSVKEYSTVYRYLSSFVKSQTQLNQIIPTSNLRWKYFLHFYGYGFTTTRTIQMFNSNVGRISYGQSTCTLYCILLQIFENELLFWYHHRIWHIWRKSSWGSCKWHPLRKFISWYAGTGRGATKLKWNDFGGKVDAKFFQKLIH